MRLYRSRFSQESLGMFSEVRNLPHSRPISAPAVRSKTGAHVQFPLLNSGADRQHNRPTFHPRASSDRSQQLHLSKYSFPPAQHSSHSYSSDIPPVISHASSDQSTVTQRLFNWIITANHIIHILENQSELTRMLMKQQLLITLPQ